MAATAVTGMGALRDGGDAAAAGTEAVAGQGLAMEGGARVIRHAPLSRNPTPSRAYYFWLMLPAIIVLACITIYPFFWLIWMSLHDVEIGAGGDTWNNFRNWTRLPADRKFTDGWWLLARYSLMCLTMQVTLGLLLAVILNRSRFEKALVTIFLMPMMMAPVVAGLVWYYLYNSTFGWYHWIMQSAGILGERSILGDTSTAMLGIVIVDTWQWTPLITLIVLAGLKRVPRDQLEANMVDGAGEIRNFFQITLPNIYPFLLIAILLRCMDNFRFIDAILVLTGGGPADATKILPTYLFDVSFQFFRLGRVRRSPSRCSPSRSSSASCSCASSTARRAGRGRRTADGLLRHRPVPLAPAQRGQGPGGVLPRPLPRLDRPAARHHVRLVLQGPARGVQAAGGRGLVAGHAVLRLHADLKHYVNLFQNNNFSTYLTNSIIASVGSAIISWFGLDVRLLALAHRVPRQEGSLLLDHQHPHGAVVAVMVPSTPSFAAWGWSARCPA
jgi:multiple sugar transport system permease protein